jgi:hypothetical protein
MTFRRVPATAAAALLLSYLSGPATAQDAAAARQAATDALASEEQAAASARLAQASAEAAKQASTQVTQATMEAVAAVATVRTMSSEMLDRAQWLEKIATTSIWLFGVVGTLASILAFAGVGFSLKRIAANVRKTSDAAKRIDEMRAGIESHHLFLKTIEGQVEVALEDIQEKLLEALTPSGGLVGVDLKAPVPQRSYDDDALIVFADRLSITGKTLNPLRMSEFLVMASNYWRRMKDYGRAIARAQRAIDLDKESPTAHKAYARALWNMVAEELAPSKQASQAQKTILLDAERAITRVRELLAKQNRYDEELAFDSATIARLLGDYAGAEKTYREGLAFSQEIARSEGREPDWDFAFALACLLATTNRYGEALEQLKAVVDKMKSWRSERREIEARNYREWVREDPDFRNMLADRTWKSAIDDLLKTRDQTAAEFKPFSALDSRTSNPPSEIP